MEPVGQINISIGEGHITDVWAQTAPDGRSYAYLGSFDEPFCSSEDTGVFIIDITDPANPFKAGFIPSPPGTYVSDVNISRIETAFFTGDVLVHGSELCRGETRTPTRVDESPGIVLYDINNPLSPRRLAPEFSLGFEAHNAFAYAQGDKAYVMVVEDDSTRDFHIVDITDTANPVDIMAQGKADWVNSGSQAALGEMPIAFVHDIWAQAYPANSPLPYYAGRTIGYLSYWDAGLVILDITDPKNPVFLGDSDYADPDPVSGFPPEGNSHSAVPTADGRLVFMGDEDFSPYFKRLKVDSGRFAGTFRAVEAGFSRPLNELEGGRISGRVVFIGGACDSAAIPPPPQDSVSSGVIYIALIERGGCEFVRKAMNAEAAGYDAALIFNTADAAGQLFRLEGNDANVTIPILGITRTTAFTALGIDPASPPDTALPATGTTGETVTMLSQFNGWGYGRILDVSNPSAGIKELGQAAVENTMAEPPPPGDHSIHNMVVEGSRAYVSWYGDGIRVIDFSSPEKPREIAYFVDEEAGSDFWGVYLYKHPDGGSYILGSDRNTGLWIFRKP